MNKIDCLDHGYVILHDTLGDDLTAVNAARVSFDKQSELEWVGLDHRSNLYTMKAADKRLLRYLAEHNHTSPFRHCVLSFEVYAPLMVMRQLGKYRVGSSFTFEDENDSLEAWNESSRRYITEEPEFYIPDVWRSAPENRKQGSGDPVMTPEIEQARAELQRVTWGAIQNYNAMLDSGVCAEQARLFLPAYALYIRARWTVSLQGIIHFLQQRLGEDSQWEIQQFAAAVRDLAKPKFPESFQVWGL